MRILFCLVACVVGAAASGESFFGVDSAASWLSSPGSFKFREPVADSYRFTVDRIAETGFPQARERLSWGQVNPAPGTWKFDHYLRVYDLYREKGIRVSGIFHDTPNWLEQKGKLATDLAKIYDFCRRLGETFGDRVEDWEFWNEEDIGFCEASAWDYVAAAKAAYLGFKDARPKSPVLMGALCRPTRSAYDDLLFANDLGFYTDAVNFHIYSALSDYPTVFGELQKFLGQNGLGERAVWVTESGTHQEGGGAQASVLSGLRAHSPAQERLHAELAAKSQFALMMEGVSRDYFFCFPPYNEQEGNKDWGMMRRDGTLKPAAAVFAEMNRRLGRAELKGEVALAKGVRGYAFRQPDGTTTLAFVSEGPVDSGRPVGEQDGAPEVPFEFQGRKLTAKAFPGYVDGLGEVPVSRAAKPRGRMGARPAAVDEDRRIVLQLKEEGGTCFQLGGGKSQLEWNGQTGRMTVVVYNFEGCEKTGVVEVVSGHLTGLPDRVRIPAWGRVELVGRYDSAEDLAGERLVLQGWFEGRKTSRLVANVFNPVALRRTCVPVVVDLKDESRWTRNDSADVFEAAWDSDAGARRFHLVWRKDVDRWAYPRYRLKPGELAGAVLLDFEIRSAQDKVENDFATENLILFTQGKTRFFGYAAPLGTWEKRTVELSAERDLDSVEALSIGLNPRGHDLTYWIRNVRIYRR